MALPYNFNQNDNNFRFETDKGIFYAVSFADGSFYFTGLPPYIPVFEVSITVISLGDYFTPPKDLRVELTIVEIFRIFLSQHENSIVYICDNLDDKQAARHRKFDTWFSKHAQIDIEKYNTYFLVNDLEIYSSLILHSHNPFKEELIRVFLNQANEYDEK